MAPQAAIHRCHPPPCACLAACGRPHPTALRAAAPLFALTRKVVADMPADYSVTLGPPFLSRQAESTVRIRRGQGLVLVRAGLAHTHCRRRSAMCRHFACLAVGLELDAVP